MSSLKSYGPQKKKPVPARVPEICTEMLHEIADAQGWTLTLTLEVAIRELHKRVKKDMK